MSRTFSRRTLISTTVATGLISAVASRRISSSDVKNPRIRIGQIGVGHAHASKLSVYRQSPDYEVVGIVEPDADLRRRAESQEAFRGLTWMPQDQLLSTPGLQAVLVETRVGDLL